jgi:hypothetical protein
MKMTNTNISASFRPQIEEMLNDIGTQIDSICGDCDDVSYDLVRALILDGCRSVLVGENLFLIYGDTVLDLQVSDEYDVMNVLDQHDFCCSPRPVYAMVWRSASEEFCERANQLELLLQQAGQDPAILLAACTTSADEKAVIERLNQEYGPGFFTMKAEEWEDEEEDEDE